MKHGLRSVLLCLLLLLFLSLLLPPSSAAELPLQGIDVSRWQGEINWTKAKKSGVSFAVLRCYAYGKDSTFDANYDAASAKGIALGAYVYMYATTPQGAVQEAQRTLEALDGKALTLPLFLDVEDASVFRLSTEALTDLCLIELQLFAAAGYRVGFYTSMNHASTEIDAARLSDYQRWIARWTCYTTDQNKKTFTFADQSPSGTKKPDCEMWQFSNGGKGKTYGVSSAYVDLDYCYVDYGADGPAVPNGHCWQVSLTERSCTAPGMLHLTCADCGETRAVAYTLPAFGHTKPDKNGCCTRCGRNLSEAPDPPQDQPQAPGQICPFCGERHRGSIGRLLLLLHTILACIKAWT